MPRHEVFDRGEDLNEPKYDYFSFMEKMMESSNGGYDDNPSNGEAS
jgi:hypothetical protein